MKYIIDLPDNTHWIQWIMKSTKDHHPYMGWKQVEDLTPYIESDMKTIEDKIWELNKKILKMTLGELKEAGISSKWPFDSSYQEVKEKYEKWLKEKRKFHFGDEVKLHNGVKAAILDISIAENTITVFTENNHIEKWEMIHIIEKTGRHFDEVEKLVRRMRKEE